MPLLLLGFGCELFPEVAIGSRRLPANEDPWAFVFQHFDDDRTADLQLGIVALRERAFKADYAKDVEDRALTPAVLRGASLGGLSIPTGASADEQEPVALPALSRFELPDHRELAVEPNRVCVQAEWTKWARRTFTSEDDCFADGTCDRLEYEQPTRYDNPVIGVWYDQFGSYRVVDVSFEGDRYRALLHRYWIEEVANSDFGPTYSWDQLFGLQVVIPDEDGSVVWNVEWASAELVVSEEQFRTLQVVTLDQMHQFSEEFVAGGDLVSCAEDRGADRPPRD